MIIIWWEWSNLFHSKDSLVELSLFFLARQRCVWCGNKVDRWCEAAAPIYFFFCRTSHLASSSSIRNNIRSIIRKTKKKLKKKLNGCLYTHLIRWWFSRTPLRETTTTLSIMLLKLYWALAVTYSSSIIAKGWGLLGGWNKDNTAYRI